MVCAVHFVFNTIYKRETLDQERILTVLGEKSTAFLYIWVVFLFCRLKRGFSLNCTQ